MSYFNHIAIDQIPLEHPVAQFNAMWEKLATAEKPVRWSLVTPEEVAPMLPWLLLLELQSDGRYYYRICGTRCETFFGLSYQGKYFGDDLPPEAVEQRRQEFEAVVRNGNPIFSETTLPIPEKEDREIYRGVFGFSSDGQIIDKLSVIIAPK